MYKKTILTEGNFLTPKELSEILDKRVSATTINTWIRNGEIPALRLGRKNLIPMPLLLAQLTPTEKAERKPPKSNKQKKAMSTLPANTINDDIDLEIILKAKNGFNIAVVIPIHGILEQRSCSQNTIALSLNIVKKQ